MDFFERKGKKPTTKTTGGAGVGKSVTQQWTQPILFTVLVFCFFFFLHFSHQGLFRASEKGQVPRLYQIFGRVTSAFITWGKCGQNINSI